MTVERSPPSCWADGLYHLGLQAISSFALGCRMCRCVLGAQGLLKAWVRPCEGGEWGAKLTAKRTTADLGLKQCRKDTLWAPLRAMKVALWHQKQNFQQNLQGINVDVSDPGLFMGDDTGTRG
jgi:hypothetical protein